MAYIITVTQLVSEKLLQPDDLATNPTGTYIVYENTEASALDTFHRTIPIKNLDDFNVTAAKLPNSTQAGFNETQISLASEVLKQFSNKTGILDYDQRMIELLIALFLWCDKTKRPWKQLVEDAIGNYSAQKVSSVCKL